MSQLIVLGFDAPSEAEEVRRELVDLQQDHLIALEDAVVVVHHNDGKVELRQAYLASLARSAPRRCFGARGQVKRASRTRSRGSHSPIVR